VREYSGGEAFLLGGYPVCVSLSCREPRTAGGRSGGKDSGRGGPRNEIRVEANADAEV
jgi:hypothetical protein